MGFDINWNLILCAHWMDGKVKIIDPNSGKTVVDQFGPYGTRDGNLKGPSSVLVDRNGDVAIVETMQGKVRIFSKQGKFLRAIEMEMEEEPNLVTTKQNGPDRPTKRNPCPVGMAMDDQGNLFVTDLVQNHVYVFGEDHSTQGNTSHRCSFHPGDQKKTN